MEADQVISGAGLNKESKMKIRQVTLIVLLALGTLAAPLFVDAQQRGKVPRIGILSPGSPGPAGTLDAFLQGLRELGYVEGKNIAIDPRFAEGKLDRLPEFASEHHPHCHGRQWRGCCGRVSG